MLHDRNPNMRRPDGWVRVNAANRAYYAPIIAERKERVLKMTLGGMSGQAIADALGYKSCGRQAVTRIRHQLREEGRLGCCMAPSCLAVQRHHGKIPEGGDCPWLIK